MSEFDLDLGYSYQRCLAELSAEHQRRCRSLGTLNIYQFQQLSDLDGLIGLQGFFAVIRVICYTAA